MKKMLIGFTLMLAMALTATSGFAEEMNHDAALVGHNPGQAEMTHTATDGSAEEEKASKEDVASTTARKKFLQETLELRASIAKKNMELEVLRLADPEDPKAIKEIRKELIDLNSELNKKALDADMERHGMDIGIHMKGYSGMGDGHKGPKGDHDNADAAGHDGGHDGGKMGKKMKAMDGDEAGDKKKCK